MPRPAPLPAPFPLPGADLYLLRDLHDAESAASGATGSELEVAVATPAPFRRLRAAGAGAGGDGAPAQLCLSSDESLLAVVQGGAVALFALDRCLFDGGAAGGVVAPSAVVGAGVGRVACVAWSPAESGGGAAAGSAPPLDAAARLALVVGSGDAAALVVVSRLGAEVARLRVPGLLAAAWLPGAAGGELMLGLATGRVQWALLSAAGVLSLGGVMADAGAALAGGAAAEAHCVRFLDARTAVVGWRPAGPLPPAAVEALLDDEAAALPCLAVFERDGAAGGGPWVRQAGERLGVTPSINAWAIEGADGAPDFSRMDFSQLQYAMVQAPAAWGLTAASAFVLAFAGGLPQPVAFAVWTNVTTCAASPVPGTRAACGGAGVDEMGCLALGCCFDEALPANASGVPACYAAAPAPAQPGACPAGERADCGYNGISRDECENGRSCCWDSAPAPAGPQCFFHAGQGVFGPVNVSFAVAPAADDACFDVTDVFGYARGSVCAVAGVLAMAATDGPAYLL